MVDFQQALVGMAIRLSLFDEVFKEYYRVNELHVVDVALNPEDQNSPVIAVELEPPELSFDAARDPQMFLHLRGEFPHPLLPDTVVPVDLEIDLNFGTRIHAAEVAKLILIYEGIGSINPELDALLTPFLEGDTADERLTALSEIFAENAIIQTLTDLELDIIRPLVEGLSAALFAEDEAPPASTWGTAIRVLPASGEQTASSIGIFVSLPEEFPFPGVTESFLPASHSLVLAYSRAFLDRVLQASADERVGEEIEGAEILDLDLHMNDDSIQISGQVKKGVKVSFAGPVGLHLIRGTGVILTDASAVEVDTPDALLGFLKFVAVLLGATVIAAQGLGKLLQAIEDLENADASVKAGLTASLQRALLALTDGLRFTSDVQGVSVVSTIDTLRVVDGDFLFLSHLFARPRHDTIARAFYGKKARKFVLFQLGSGRRFSAASLARLVGAEKIVIDGVHDVGSQHVRTDPDATDDNNLLEVFGELAPDEPTIEDVPDDEDEE